MRVQTHGQEVQHSLPDTEHGFVDGDAVHPLHVDLSVVCCRVVCCHGPEAFVFRHENLGALEWPAESSWSKTPSRHPPARAPARKSRRRLARDLVGEGGVARRVRGAVGRAFRNRARRGQDVAGVLSPTLGAVGRRGGFGADDPGGGLDFRGRVHRRTQPGDALLHTDVAERRIRRNAQNGVEILVEDRGHEDVTGVGRRDRRF